MEIKLITKRKFSFLADAPVNFRDEILIIFSKCFAAKKKRFMVIPTQTFNTFKI